MKTIFNKTKALGLMLAVGLLSACTQDASEYTNEAGGKLTFKIYDAAVTRTATDGQTMVTSFEPADRAGLYAVKGGQVILSNIPLTFTVNGFWEADEAIQASDELSGARFYAYFPYSEEALFDAAASNPFDAMIAARQPAGKQNTKADYEAADLMVTTAASIGQYNTVSLPLQHQKAMVCIELPNSSYIFSNAGMDPYVLSKSEHVQFALDGTAVQPYFDESSQSYRLIVEPGTEGPLAVSFTNNGMARTFETTGLSQLQGGKFAKYVVDGGAQLINTTLQVGDYYCSDGRIVGKDTPAEELPGNIVGVVFKLGTTEALRSANSSWSHGVVVGLDEVRGKWGTNSSTNSEQNAAGWRYWYRDHGLADQGSTNATALIEDNMAEEGYETTKAWRAVPQPLEIGGIVLDYTTELNVNMDRWIDSTPLPAVVCSGWYVPSLRDLQNLESQSQLLSQQLAAVGGKDLLWNTGSTDRYWSCNVRGSGSNWCYVGGQNALNDRYKGVACNGNSYYRFMFAF